MKKQKPKFPVAAVREDGVPAIWLTFGNWMVIRNGLRNEYMHNRELIGRFNARKTAGKPWKFDAMVLHFEEVARDEAMALYRIGYEAHRSVEERGGCYHQTPEKLVEQGDKLEKRAFEAELKKLTPGDQAGG